MLNSKAYLNIEMHTYGFNSALQGTDIAVQELPHFIHVHVH